jgi:DNA polymerase-4
MRRLGRTLRLELIYSDHVSVNAETKLPEPLDLDRPLFQAASALLDRAWSRRTRLRHLALGVRDLQEGPRQLQLFGGEAEDKERRLLGALDQIRERFGDSAVRQGRTM